MKYYWVEVLMPGNGWAQRGEKFDSYDQALMHKHILEDANDRLPLEQREVYRINND